MEILKKKVSKIIFLDILFDTFLSHELMRIWQIVIYER